MTPGGFVTADAVPYLGMDPVLRAHRLAGLVEWLVADPAGVVSLAPGRLREARGLLEAIIAAACLEAIIAAACLETFVDGALGR